MDQRPAILILSAPMPPFSSMPYFSEALLAALALIPVALAWGMGFFGSRSEEVSRITTQSPLGTHEDHAPHDVLLTPLVHISRTDRAEDQRNLALGLRQVRVEQAAPLLRHFMRSTDPELALFSQSILQQSAPHPRRANGSAHRRFSIGDWASPRLAHAHHTRGAPHAASGAQ